MMLFCNNQFDANQILFKKPSCWLWGILRIGLCFLLFTYNIFYMEGVVADQKLVAEIQRMMDNEQSFDLTDISGRNDSLGATRVADIINYVKADPKITLQNMDLATENLNKANFGQYADNIQGIQNVTQETFEKLERMRVDARQTVLSERFDQFVSVVRRRMERISNVVAELTKKPDLSQGDLMRIQYEVMQMSITLDVASKVGDKGSQALQTLFRNQ